MTLEDTPEDLYEFNVNPIEELVNHPSHYQGNGLEAIDVIEAFSLGFNIGNVIKYLLRARRKESYVRDLEKAKWYLEREISRVNNLE